MHVSERWWWGPAESQVPGTDSKIPETLFYLFYTSIIHYLLDSIIDYHDYVPSNDR
jgi:hypothetical protein